MLWKLQGVATRRGLCPAVNPCAPAVPWQTSRRHFIMQHQFSRFTIIILHTNRNQLFGADGTRRQNFEIKFSKIFRGHTPGPILQEGLPYPTPTPITA